MGKILIIQGADFSQYKVDSIKMPYNGPVEIPQISIDSESKLVTLTANENLDIYYTTDGSTPSIDSTYYTEPFTVSNSATIKAITSNSKTVSQLPEISTSVYIDYDITDYIELETSLTGTIRYTTDGSTPTHTSTEYNTSISISSGQTIKVAVFSNDIIVSKVTNIQITD